MIVRDTGKAWQLVLQTDHADLAAGFARAWADHGPRHASLVIAARRHDDGWAVWERSPLVHPDGTPVSFLDVAVPAHLAFYRACIASVTDEDAYAGLLVSMHGAGIYRRRYGADPGLVLTHAEDVRELVNRFVWEQEEAYPAREAAAGVDEQRRLADYRLLQLYDRLSLHFCMRDVAREGAELQGTRVEPAGAWRVRLDPFPFAEEPARFELVHRVLPKRKRSQREFARELLEIEPERVEIAIEAGG